VTGDHSVGANCKKYGEFMGRRHVIISGTGRAGTSFLMQVFSSLGLPTGFESGEHPLDPDAHAGLELELESRHAPYIIKKPQLCDTLDTILQTSDIHIDHAIVPIRDLFAAAESRRDVLRRTLSAGDPTEVPGGLFGTDEPHQQEAVLCQKLYQLIRTLAKHAIPLTLLDYPRLLNDGDYLYRQLPFLLTGISREEFLTVHAEARHPEWMHDFRPQL